MSASNESPQGMHGDELVNSPSNIVVFLGRRDPI